MEQKFFSIKDLLHAYNEANFININDFDSVADYFLAKSQIENILDEWSEFEFFKACYEIGLKTYNDIHIYIVNLDFDFDFQTKTITGIIKETSDIRISINIRYNYLNTICKFSVKHKSSDLYHMGIIHIKEYNKNHLIIDKLISNN
jgi:hypothetical protein